MELSLQCPFDTATREAPISEQHVLTEMGEGRITIIDPSSGTKHAKFLLCYLLSG